MITFLPLCIRQLRLLIRYFRKVGIFSYLRRYQLAGLMRLTPNSLVIINIAFLVYILLHMRGSSIETIVIIFISRVYREEIGLRGMTLLRVGIAGGLQK